jgi:hypothetical protein
MIRFFYASSRHFVADAALTVAMLCTASAAYAQASERDTNAPAGKLNFEAANLPEANVEVDLSQDMFKDIFGIGDAAIAGVAESLKQSPREGDAGQATKLAAHQLDALRQIVQLAGDVVREVHVRVYEDLPSDVEGPHALFRPFDEQLRTGNWETIARVRKDDEVVRVAALRQSGSVQGVFVVASDGRNAVLANIVCDVSPDNVKKLTSAATKIGLENGLAEKIQLKLKPTIVINGDERRPITPPATPPSPPPVPVKQ